MNTITKLGSITGKAAVQQQKQANIFLKGLGHAARSLGSFAKAKPLTAGIGGLLGASALNEGAAYAGSNNGLIPHFNPQGWAGDADPLWSPKLQGTRSATAGGLLNQIGQFVKRPVQSLFGSDGPISNPKDALLPMDISQLDKVMKGFKMGPDGKVTMELGGSMEAPMAPSYIKYLNQLKAQQHMLGGPKATTPAPAPAATPANAGGAGNTRYLFHPTPLPVSATS